MKIPEKVLDPFAIPNIEETKQGVELEGQNQPSDEMEPVEEDQAGDEYYEADPQPC